MMRQFIILALFFSSGILHAEEKGYEVNQKDIKFSIPFKVIKPGDHIIFSNKDNVVHNIISLTEGFVFDLGLIQPGKSKEIRFGEEGVVDVQCAIHPEMKMTVFIFK